MLYVVRDRPRNPEGRIPVCTGWYKIDSSLLFGQTFAEIDIRRLTGCTVIAVSRDGCYAQCPDLHLPLIQDDQIMVAGTRAQLCFFKQVFGFSEIDPPERWESKVA